MNQNKILDLFLEREALFRNIFGRVDTPKIIYDKDVEIAKNILITVFWYNEEEILKTFPTQIDQDNYKATLNAIFQFSAGAITEAEKKK